MLKVFLFDRAAHARGGSLTLQRRNAAVGRSGRRPWSGRQSQDGSQRVQVEPRRPSNGPGSGWRSAGS